MVHTPGSAAVGVPHFWLQSLYVSVHMPCSQVRHAGGEHVLYTCPSQATALGDKPFILGKETSPLDAAAFGLLANVLFDPLDNPLKHYVQSDPRLRQFVERIKTRAWPDWAECCQTHKDGNKFIMLNQPHVALLIMHPHIIRCKVHSKAYTQHVHAHKHICGRAGCSDRGDPIRRQRSGPRRYLCFQSQNCSPP